MAFLAALAVHVGLVALLLLSFRFQSPPDQEVVQAELWSSLPSQLPADPVVTPPPPPPTPTPAPAPTPEPAPAVPSPDIIEAQERKLKEQKKREDETKKKAEAEKKRVAEAKKKEAEKKRVEEAKKKEAEARLAKQLDEQRRRELAALGLDPKAKPDSKGTDTATKSGVQGGAEIGVRAGAMPGYADAIRARIRARIRFDPSVAPQNPEAVYQVEQSPSGAVTQIKLVKSSGVTPWDEAVRRAIEASSPLPKTSDGRVERVLELRFRPRERS